MKGVVLERSMDWGQVRVEQVVEALRGGEVVGTEVFGRQVVVVVGGPVIMEKPRQLMPTVGATARPCQTSLS